MNDTSRLASCTFWPHLDSLLGMVSDSCQPPNRTWMLPRGMQVCTDQNHVQAALNNVVDHKPVLGAQPALFSLLRRCRSCEPSKQWKVVGVNLHQKIAAEGNVLHFCAPGISDMSDIT